MALGNQFCAIVGNLTKKCVDVWSTNREVGRLYLEEIIVLCLYGPKRQEATSTMAGTMIASDDVTAQVRIKNNIILCH